MFKHGNDAKIYLCRLNIPLTKEKSHTDNKRGLHDTAKNEVGESVSTSKKCEISPTSSCRWLADAFVCVDVALTVRAGVCHILEVINQAGNQAAAKVTPEKESADRLFAASVECLRACGSGCILTPLTQQRSRRGRTVCS